MARKTIEVNRLKLLINDRLANQTMSPDGRRELASLMSVVLHETGNYKGFNYVEWYLEGGCERWRQDGSPTDNTPYLGDLTRVVFH